MKRKAERTTRKRGEDEILSLLGEKAPKEKKGRRWLPVTIAAAVGAAAILLIVFLVIIPNFGSKEEDSTVYRQYTVERGNVIVGQNESSSISLSRETVTFAVSSTVKEVYVKAGSSVKEGDPLMKLDADQIRTGLNSYEVELRAAELEVENAKLAQQVGTLEAKQAYQTTVQTGKLSGEQKDLTVEQLEYNVESAQAALDDAKEQYDKYYQLSLSYPTAKAKLESLEAEVEAAQLHVDAIAASSTSLTLANARLSEAKEALSDYQSEFTSTYGNDISSMADLSDKLDTLENSIAKAQLDLTRAQLALTTGTTNASQTSALAKTNASTAETTLELAELKLQQAVDSAEENYDTLNEQLAELKQTIADDGVVKAPCTGLVASVNAEAGDSFTVSYNETLGTLMKETLCTLTNITDVYVPITISEEDILSVSIGQEALVTMSAFEGTTFPATVDSITVESSRSGAATVTYTVNVRLDGDNTQLMYEGMSADVTIVQRAAKDVLYVSNQAITNTNGQATVKKLVNGEYVTANVTTGFSDGRYTEIKSGLSEGDVVVAESAVTGS